MAGRKRKRSSSRNKRRKKKRPSFDRKVLKVINKAQGGGWGDIRNEFGAANSIVRNDKVVKLKYAEFRDFTMSATLNSNHDYVIYRPDSPYDPRHAVGGHQPFGWDQLSQFYAHYLVLGSRLRATVWSEGAGATSKPVVAYAHLQDDTTDPLYDASYWMENAAVTKKMVSGQPYFTPKDMNSPRTLNAYYSHRKFYDRTGTGVSTAVGSNPSNTRTPYFLVGVQGLDQTDEDIPDLKVLIEVEYTIMLKDPLEQAQS